MPRYHVLDGFRLGALGRDVYPPDVVEIAEREARPHLSIGRLRPADDPPAAEAAPAPEPPPASAPNDSREPKTTSRSPRGAGKEE